MTRKDFDTKYEHIFLESNIIRFIKYKKRNDLADCIIDTAAAVEAKYDTQRAYISKAFTPHDFEHHITKVIELADQILCGNIEKFKPDDLFCFMMACILHDIGMIYAPKENRFYHSYVAADLISDIISSGTNDLYKEIRDLAKVHRPKLNEDVEEKIKTFEKIIGDKLDELGVTTEQKQEIAVMILGHSNLKFPGHTINTLDNRLFAEWDFDSYTDVRALAAFLRWADELDLSQSRCSRILRTELPEESREFWDKLKLIKKVNIANGLITLTIDREKYIKTTSPKIIYEIIEKLDQERDTCNELFLECGKEEYLLPVVTISPRQKDIIEDYEDYKKKTGPSVATEPLNEDESNSSGDLPSEKLDTKHLKRAIQNCIKERELLKEGHYCLHTMDEEGIEETFCIRNPLDCNGLLSRHDLLDDISQELLLQIAENREINLDDYMLVGVANSGALIAAHMAAISGMLFTSIVPNNKCTKYTPPEKNLNDIIRRHSSKKVILVIGINYTGTAIIDACKRIKNVEWVVGLINRDIPSKGYEGTIQKLQRMGIDYYFILNKYKIDRCKYHGNIEECPYNAICNQHPFK